jgi:SanA protein
MPNWFTRKRLVLGAAGAVLIGATLVFLCDLVVSAAGSGRIFIAVHALPQADVALVLGTTPRVAGRRNPFYEARLDAAADLFRSGVVRGLLVSGDNSRKAYDEPSCMKADLVARGIPSEFITCDFAGFSTLDSIKRAGPVFGQERVILVSQRFHLERALFLAKSAELEADGYAAQDAPFSWQLRVRSREALARVKAVLDVLLDRQPRFLGEREVVNLAVPTRGR